MSRLARWAHRVAPRQRPAILPELRAQMDADEAICEACGIDEALDELYNTYEKDGAMPTREALADLIRPQNELAAQVVQSMKRDPFAPCRARKLVLPVALLACAVCIAGIAVAFNQPAAKEPAPSTPIASESKAGKESKVTVHVKADGIDGDAAAPGGIAITLKSGASSDEDWAVFGLSGPEIPCGEFAEGGYELVVTSAPILMDSSTYKVPDDPVEFEVADDGEAVTVEVELEKIPVDGMAKEQLGAVAAQMEASGFGGDILEGGYECRDYVPERTCRNVGGDDWGFKCSECGGPHARRAVPRTRRGAERTGEALVGEPWNRRWGQCQLSSERMLLHRKCVFFVNLENYRCSFVPDSLGRTSVTFSFRGRELGCTHGRARGHESL